MATSHHVEKTFTLKAIKHKSATPMIEIDQRHPRNALAVMEQLMLNGSAIFGGLK